MSEKQKVQKLDPRVERLLALIVKVQRAKRRAAKAT